MALRHLSERLRRAAAVMGVVSALGPSGCRGGHDASPARGEASDPALAAIERELAAVAGAFDGGETREAGRLLAGTLRDVEGNIASARRGLDVDAAETFEAVRRAADRWQAGVPSSDSDAHALLSRLEDQAERILDPQASTRNPEPLHRRPATAR